MRIETAGVGSAGGVICFFLVNLLETFYNEWDINRILAGGEV